MLENSDVSKDKFGLDQSQRGRSCELLTHPHSELIATPPQHEDLEGTLHNGGHLELPDKNRGNGQILESDQKNAHHSDQNPKLILPDSVVINLDNIEPSTSHSVDSQVYCSNEPYPEQCQINIAEVKSAGNSSEQNLSNDSIGRNTSGDPHNSNNSYNNNNNNNNSNSNNNSNNDNNNSNNSLGTENNERTQAEGQSPRTNARNNTSGDIFFFNKYADFVVFLLAKIIFDHREGILIFIGLFVTFIHANSVVKREVAKQNRRSFISLGIIFVNLFVSICLIYFVFQDQQLYKSLIFILPSTELITMWDVLWIVGITDFVLKFITIQLKVGILCIPEKLMAFSARGKWYLLLESASQLYRSLVPIQPWLYYVTELYDGPGNAVGMFFFATYTMAKGSDILCTVKLFLKAIRKMLQNTSLGTRPSKAELASAGYCPICHDEYNAPIILPCKHIFCESCVSVWFDREQTCPLCRAKVADDPSWRDGATSFLVQLF